MSDADTVAIVIPVRNEENSFYALWRSIQNQKYQPDEIVIVDGGSIDKTVDVIKNLIKNDSRAKLVLTKGAMPGEGRNIGISESHCNLIALTDCGIVLDTEWLFELVSVYKSKGHADIVYGNYDPIINSLFTECAAIAYVPSKQLINTFDNIPIRAPFIASSLLKREVWKSVGGFPSWRAAEDLIFINTLKSNGYTEAYAPNATVAWLLRPDTRSTFNKFHTYSIHNVWAGMAKYWHYGIVRHHLCYLSCSIFTLLFAKPSIINVIFSYFVISLFGYLLRAIKSYHFKKEFRINHDVALLNSMLIKIMTVLCILVIIDLAVMSGWIVAIAKKKKF